MDALYLDTSALVKLYAREQGSEWLVLFTESYSSHELYIARLAGPELVAALIRKANRGEISLQDAQESVSEFRQEWNHDYQIVEVRNEIADLAMTLAEKHGLRGYDAVHLATALHLQNIRQAIQESPLIFISADVEQLDAAKAEGLQTDNPSNHVDSNP